MTPPNLLVIMADDQRADGVQYMPNVRNRLIESGRLFTSCRCNTGLCQPTRVGFLTGQWANHHGVRSNLGVPPDGDPPLGYSVFPDTLYGNSIRAFNHDETIATWLAAPGHDQYECGMFGKYLNAVPAIAKPTGWTTWRQLVGESTYQPTTYQVNDGIDLTTTTMPAKYQTEWLSVEVTAFIHNATQPWFALATPTSVHTPWDPHPDDLLAWSDLRFPLVLEDNVDDKPFWVRRRGAPDPAQIRAAVRAQLREANALDRFVGDVLDELDRRGQADNTIVMYCSDNGMSYGEHRAWPTLKNEAYDTSLLVPLIVRGPDFPAGVSDELVSMGADLTATCVAAAGATAGYPPDGVDLRDVVANPTAYTSRTVLLAKGLPEPNNILAPLMAPRGDGIVTRTSNGLRKVWRWYNKLPTVGTIYEAYKLDNDEDPIEDKNLVRLNPPDPEAPSLIALLETTLGPPP